MEEEYNWNLIMKAAGPIALVEAYIFYTSLGNFWKWSSLVLGMSLAGFIIYISNKRKSDMFTAIGIIFLTALIIRFLKNFGLL